MAALSSPCEGDLPVAGFEVLRHFHRTSSSTAFHVQLYVVLELVFWGRVSHFSLNPQLTRHHRSQSCQ